MATITIELRGEYIELNQLLKLAGVCDSGGQGKQLVLKDMARIDDYLRSLRDLCEFLRPPGNLLDFEGLEKIVTNGKKINMVPQKTSDTLHESIHKALRVWHEVDAHEDTLLENLLIVRARRQNHVKNGVSLAGRLAANEILLEGIEKLALKDEIGARILRERFLNDEITLKVAFRLEMGQIRSIAVNEKGLKP